jgi:endonuclease/exonuclease/phosphatase family metal-dependent hydrolase
VIRAQSPDIICFQEMWAEQLLYLRTCFSAFEWFGTVDEPRGRNPMNAVFFRSEAFTQVSAGCYWLSETPHIPGSISWDSRCVRLANWLRLEEAASGKEFRVVNTHLDHVGQLAREKQAALIVEDTRAYADQYAQILTGDMNCEVKNKAIGIFKAGGWQDTYAAVRGEKDPGHTYHGFLGPGFEADMGKIDWIFARGAARVIGAEIIRDSRDGRFPSDHYFVSADILLDG